tara:strand:- start:24364 stop:24630 length:267 start_codon:yes stop_codon:yes gene_type:complete
MSLEEMRSKIEEIDEKIMELIAERMDIAILIANIKERDGLPITDKNQEKKVMQRVSENAEIFGMDKEGVEKIFQMLIELNKNKQRRKD